MPTEAEAVDMAKPADDATTSPQEDKTEKPQKDPQYEPSAKMNASETDNSENPIEKKTEAEDVASKNQDRLQRFKALQARAVSKSPRSYLILTSTNRVNRKLLRKAI